MKIEREERYSANEFNKYSCVSFDLSCTRLCLERWSLRANLLRQTVHWYGLSPVCDLKCRPNSSDLENRHGHFSHGQMNGFSPVCRRTWAFKWEDLKYTLSQFSNGHLSSITVSMAFPLPRPLSFVPFLTVWVEVPRGLLQLPGFRPLVLLGKVGIGFGRFGSLRISGLFSISSGMVKQGGWHCGGITMLGCPWAVGSTSALLLLDIEIMSGFFEQSWGNLLSASEMGYQKDGGEEEVKEVEPSGVGIAALIGTVLSGENDNIESHEEFGPISMSPQSTGTRSSNDVFPSKILTSVLMDDVWSDSIELRFNCAGGKLQLNRSRQSICKQYN